MFSNMAPEQRQTTHSAQRILINRNPIILFQFVVSFITVSRGGSRVFERGSNLQRSSFCYFLLAHLSRRLIGELIVYPWSGVRRPSVRPSSSTMLKPLLLRNRSADQSQILCGASLGKGNEILFAAFGSHDQDGRHAHIW